MGCTRGILTKRKLGLEDLLMLDRRKMLTNLAASGAAGVELEGQEFGPNAPKFKGPGYLGKLPLN